MIGPDSLKLSNVTDLLKLSNAATPSKLDAMDFLFDNVSGLRFTIYELTGDVELYNHSDKIRCNLKICYFSFWSQKLRINGHVTTLLLL